MIKDDSSFEQKKCFWVIEMKLYIYKLKKKLILPVITKL